MAKRGRPAKLSAEDQALVRELYRKPGNSAPVLGRLFRVSAGTILKVVSKPEREANGG